MAVEKLTAGVVGAGYMGEQHARVYAEHPSIEFDAVVDLDAERADQVAEEWGATRSHTDLDAALSESPLDVVTVATPETAHRGPVETALAAGAHVLLEKPVAADEGDARAIGDAVEAADPHLLMGYLCRFHPRYAALKEEIDAGELGDLLAVQAARVSGREIYEMVADWTHPMYYLAVHDIDMLRWYTESEVVRVQAEASSGLDGGETPAVVHATLRFADGTAGVIEANWARAEEYPAVRTDEVRVTGTDGYARLVNEAPGDDGLRVGTRTGFDYPGTTDLHGVKQDFLRREIDHLVDCARGDAEPLVTWRDGLESLRVANAVIDAVDAGEPVALDRD